VTSALLAGLIGALPVEGAVWSAENRRRWLLMASRIFDVVYTRDAADDRDIVITIAPDADA